MLPQCSYANVISYQHYKLPRYHQISTLRLVGVENVEERLASSTLGNRLLNRSLVLRLALLSEEFLTTKSLGVGVESEEDGLVSEGVLLLGEGAWYRSAGHASASATYAWQRPVPFLGARIGSRQS